MPAQPSTEFPESQQPQTSRGRLDPGITVIIPTYNRIADLDRCLAAIDRQQLKPAAVFITCRKDDPASWDYLRRNDRPCLETRVLLVDQPGVVYALNAGIDQVQTELFALTDDDSVPHPDWLQRIVAHFNADPSPPSLAGVGGKDHVCADGRWLEGAEPVVGRITWWGMAIGNHHLGIGPPRYVETLKGVNMAFRTEAFGDLRLDSRLRGKGAQVGWELQLCLTLIARGYKLLYDPAVLVDHIPGTRPVEENRASFNPVSLSDEVFNRTLLVLEFLATRSWGLLRQVVYLGYMTLRGTRKAPGLALLAYGLAVGSPDTWARFKAAMAAYRDAIQAARPEPK
jgi:GT2 family glycosyltransferase